MSSAFQAVQRGDNLTGCGYRRFFTPAHQLERPTGNICRMVFSRTKPVSGNKAEELPNFSR